MPNAESITVGFIGSCPAEQFVEYAYDDFPIYKAYRVNTISIMSGLDWPDQVRQNWPIDAQRRFKFESRKDFLQRLIEKRPEILVLDFTRDVRMPILAKSGSYMSYGYEFRLSDDVCRSEILAGVEIIEFGTEKYLQIYQDSLDRFVNFLNREMNQTRILIVVPAPTADYRGRLMSRELYFRDFVQWQIRYPIYERISEYAASRIKNCQMFHFCSQIYSDDHAEYGASAVHYAPNCWSDLVRNLQAHNTNSVGVGDRIRASAGLVKQLNDIKSHLISNAGKTDVDLLHEVVPYLFNVARSDPALYFSSATTPDDVVNSFLWIMGRLPENFDTFYNHYAFEKKGDLRSVLLESGEFKEIYKAICESTKIS